MIEISDLVSQPSLYSGRFCDDVHFLFICLLAICIDAHVSDMTGDHYPHMTSEHSRCAWYELKFKWQFKTNTSSLGWWRISSMYR